MSNAKAEFFELRKKVNEAIRHAWASGEPGKSYEGIWQVTCEYPGADEGDAEGPCAEEKITWEMMTAAGLTGTPDSRARREALAEKLGISYGNAKAMLSHMNAFGVTTGEFNEAVRAIDDKTDKK